jgi:acyl-CoA thioester hydrolase
MVERDRDLDDALERLARVAGGILPDRLEHLVHFEEEPLVPECGRDPARAHVRVPGGIGIERGDRAERARRVRRGGLRVRAVDVEQDVRSGIDEMDAREALRRCERKRRALAGEPCERRRGVGVVARRERELRERVPEWERESGRHRTLSSTAPVWYHARVVPAVYTAHVPVRHDELDRFGRLHPGVYLRYLAHAAVEASAAAGFDAAWYATAGTMWIIRRSTLELTAPACGGERLAIATWVEDFRRVRSHRRYSVRDADGSPRLEARTDWVYVDAASGRPRRIPADFEGAFGVVPEARQERAGWDGPPSPREPARSQHRVRVSDLDGIGHVNNAVYLDLLAQAVLDALDAAGWPLDRLVDADGAPLFGGADLEYLEGALYGDRLEIATWFAPVPGALAAHHRIGRAGSERPLVRASTLWRWARKVPAAVLSALAPVLAA